MAGGSACLCCWRRCAPDCSCCRFWTMPRRGRLTGWCWQTGMPQTWRRNGGTGPSRSCPAWYSSSGNGSRTFTSGISATMRWSILLRRRRRRWRTSQTCPAWPGRCVSMTMTGFTGLIWRMMKRWTRFKGRSATWTGTTNIWRKSSPGRSSNPRSASSANRGVFRLKTWPKRRRTLKPFSTLRWSLAAVRGSCGGLILSWGTIFT